MPVFDQGLVQQAVELTLLTGRHSGLATAVSGGHQTGIPTSWIGPSGNPSPEPMQLPERPLRQALERSAGVQADPNLNQAAGLRASMVQPVAPALPGASELRSCHCTPAW